MEVIMPPERKSFGSASSSPEFEFWMVRNPSFPQPNLHSADELFVDGVILPLHLLRLHDDKPQPAPKKEASSEVTAPAAKIPSAPVATSSKRWKDLFRGVGGEKNRQASVRRKKNRKRGAGGAAELNINIWPFSRSRSAGNSASVVGFPKHKNSNNKKKKTAVGRKVSSAPCSRSNSRGESSSKMGRSPVRVVSGGGGGVHVGRSSTIWQIRKTIKKTPPATPSATGAVEEKESGVEVAKYNSTANTGNVNQMRCAGDEKKLLAASAGGDGGGSSSSSSSSSGSIHFNLKGLFSRKVY